MRGYPALDCYSRRSQGISLTDHSASLQDCRVAVCYSYSCCRTGHQAPSPNFSILIYVLLTQSSARFDSHGNEGMGDGDDDDAPCLSQHHNTETHRNWPGHGCPKRPSHLPGRLLRMLGSTQASASGSPLSFFPLTNYLHTRLAGCCPPRRGDTSNWPLSISPWLKYSRPRDHGPEKLAGVVYRTRHPRLSW